MARAIAKCTVNIATISAPVGVYLAAADEPIYRNQTHKGCGARLKQQPLKCPTHDVTVTGEDIEKVYEYAKDQYVTITDQEWDAALENLPAKHVVDLEHFVPLDTVDRVWVEKSYYLKPEKGAEQPYVVLYQALKRTGMAGEGSIVLREREQRCVVRASEFTDANGVVHESIVMEVLYWPSEVRLVEVPPMPKVTLTEKTLEVAAAVVSMLTGEFALSGKADRAREALLALIETKKAGGEITMAALPAPAKAAPGQNMEELLRQTLANLQAAKKAAVPPVPPVEIAA